jgi:hypothetical protein
MKRNLLFWCFLFLVIDGFSQQLYVEFGPTVSAFDYKNSQGESLDNLLSKTNIYFGMGYRNVINNKQTLFVSLGVSYNGYGAIGSDNRLDNYFEWDVNYLGVNAGLDVKLFSLRDFSFYLKGSIAAEFLIRGTQTVNNQVFNLVGEDEFNNYIFFTRGHLGMQYPISRNTSLFVNYTYGRTVLIGKGNGIDQEQLKLITHQFGLGLIINLPSCNCTF